MITRIYFGTHKFATAIDMRQQVLLEKTNLINNSTSYQQMTTKGLIELINDQQSEIDHMKEMLVECGYVVCEKCGQVIHKDEATWIENELIHICEDCKRQEE